VCFDEWGPLELRPTGGVAWARANHPYRVRATYRRSQGTEQFFGFYDVHADCLEGVFRKRKRVKEVSEAFKRLRRCYPRRKLFVIMDNLRNVHDHPTFLSLLRELRIHPVWTPTESSWLNLIEAQFGVLKRFTMTNTDDRTHVERRRRVYRYLLYRHRKVGTSDHPLTHIRTIKLERH
jgi:transposase